MANSSSINRDFGWKQIADHTLTIRGDRGAEIRLVTHSVLATPHTMATPSEIAFHAVILDGGVEVQRCDNCAMYSGLKNWRAELSALRMGEREEVYVRMTGMELWIYQLPTGTTVVEGACSNLTDANLFPRPKKDARINDAMLETGDDFAYCYRFAFRTSLVDPPYIDDFIRDIDALLSHLYQFTPA